MSIDKFPLPIWIYGSASFLGGAEQSILAEIQKRNLHEGIAFLLPSKGPLTDRLEVLKITYDIMPFPAWMAKENRVNQGYFWSLFLNGPLVFFTSLRYIYKVNKILNSSATIWSLGLKSHMIAMALSFFTKRKVVLNIRDYVQPVFLRKVIKRLESEKLLEVVCNSLKVGEDYLNPFIMYPIINFKNKPVPKQFLNEKMIISHIGYFAPYKGQLLFVELANQIIRSGIEAEFWMVGDVVYEGNVYDDYKKSVLKLIKEYGLESRIKLWGVVEDVQTLLESTDILFSCTLEPEPFGRTILEALYCGCEVMCHELSGVMEMVEEHAQSPKLSTLVGSGIVFPTGYKFVSLLQEV